MKHFRKNKYKRKRKMNFFDDYNDFGISSNSYLGISSNDYLGTGNDLYEPNFFNITPTSKNHPYKEYADVHYIRSSDIGESLKEDLNILKEKHEQFSSDESYNKLSNKKRVLEDTENVLSLKRVMEDMEKRVMRETEKALSMEDTEKILSLYEDKTYGYSECIYGYDQTEYRNDDTWSISGYIYNLKIRSKFVPYSKYKSLYNKKNDIEVNNCNFVILINVFDNLDRLHSEKVPSTRIYTDSGILLLEEYHYHGKLARVEEDGNISSKPSRILYGYSELYQPYNYGLDIDNIEIKRRLYKREECYTNLDGELDRIGLPSLYRYEHNHKLTYINELPIEDRNNLNYIKCYNDLNSSNNVYTNYHLVYSCHYQNGKKGIRIKSLEEGEIDYNKNCELFYKTIIRTRPKRSEITRTTTYINSGNEYLLGNVYKDGEGYMEALIDNINNTIRNYCNNNNNEYRIEFGCGDDDISENVLDNREKDINDMLSNLLYL